MKHTAAKAEPDLDLLDLEPKRQQFRTDVLDGLARSQKRLPTQYLYDRRGSELFERICELEEYYPTRTELSIFEAHIAAMAEAIGPEAMVIEYGSGTGLKPRILLRALHHPVAYVPVEISRAHLLRSAEALDTEFPDVEVLPVCADFTEPFEIPQPSRTARRRVVFFPGSTLGNFTPADAKRLLEQMRADVGSEGAVLVGIDLQKDRAILERAYDDAKGTTATFNLNLLQRINAELGASFDLAAFRHRATYDPSQGRIVMQLVSEKAQRVDVAGQRFDFAEGEAITTEYSHKYTLEGFATMAERAGLRVARVWTDPNAWFSVQLLQPEDHAGSRTPPPA
jgi:L-histidine Nalpha-methyltransferase